LALLAVHVTGTVVRNRAWRSEETLWADVVQKSPDDGRAWMNYGLTQMEVGRYADAKRNFDEAARLWPRYPAIQVNLGIATFHLGDTTGADAHFRKALQLDPSYASTHYFYGRYLLNAGRGPEAIVQLRHAVAAMPAYGAPRHLLLSVYYIIGSESEVAQLARETLAVDPNDAVARAYAAGNPPLMGDGATPFDKGLSLTAKGDHMDAGVAYRRALRDTPQDADCYLNLGWSQAQLGFNALAAIAFQQALALRPDYALARNDLAWVQRRMAATGQTGR
jgi:tetratricopeptide (TPR) repeat protein